MCSKVADPAEPVILVDGSSYLFRAYHALPPLTTAQGEPTGAILGVLNMLRKLLKTHATSRIAVIFDTSSKNFRHRLFPAYKANRLEMPEELGVQIAPVHAMIKAMGFPLFAFESLEADDVIGTLAREAREAGHFVIISTGDKDFAQLVAPGLVLVNTMTDTQLDEAGVLNKFGVPPEQIIDYLTLVGDTADNMPGVPKVGPKTAIKWLQAYGSVEKLMEHCHEVKGKVGESLRDAAPLLPTYQKLVTIDTHLTLPVSHEDVRLHPMDEQALSAMLQRFEIRSWLDVKTPEVVVHHSCMQEAPEPLQTAEELNQWHAACSSEQALAIRFVPECSNSKGLGIVVWVQGKGFLLQGAALQNFGRCSDLTWVGHDVKTMKHAMEKAGVFCDFFCDDLMLLAYMKHSTASSFSLASLVAQANLSPLQDAEGMPPESFAMHEASCLLILKEHLWQALDDAQGDLYQSCERPLMDVLWKMEHVGLGLDVPLLNQMSQRLGDRAAQLEEEVLALVGHPFNLNSSKQLQVVLFDELGLEVVQKTPKGQPSTSEEVLSVLAAVHPVPALVLEHRSLMKLKNTYTDKLPLRVDPQSGRLHTTFHQTVTATGRLSSSEPNVQNIPIRHEWGAHMRAAFVAAPGKALLALDYSQIELRIMAHLSQDPSLIRAFQEDQDIHAFTASEIFHVAADRVTAEQRRSAKAINFGLIYGMSPFGLAKQLGADQATAAAYMEHYFERYPGVKHYMDRMRALVQQQGYVSTLWGRRLYLPDIHAKGVMKRRAAERAAINAPMQGTAADIIKKAMVAIDALIEKQQWPVRLVLQVHDELVFEGEEEVLRTHAATIAHTMTHVANLAVPLQVHWGVGANWLQAHT